MNFPKTTLAYVGGTLLLLAVIIYILLSPGFTAETPPLATPEASNTATPAATSPPSSPMPAPSLHGSPEDVLLDPTVIAGEWVSLVNNDAQPFSNERLASIDLQLTQTPTSGIWRSVPGGSDGSVTAAHEMVLIFGSVPAANDAYTALAAQLTAAGLAPGGITFADASYLSFSPEQGAAVFLNRVGHKLYLLYFELDEAPARLADLFDQWATITNGRLARL